jgi:hypothetical protein
MNEDRGFNRPLAIRHPDFDLASEQKLIEVLQELEGLSASFNAEDFASETTLSSLKTAFDVRDLATESTLEATRLLLLSLDGKDFASELTLDFFRSDFNSRDISTSAKQDDVINELGAVNLELDAQSTKLDSLDSKDYATESSLSDLNSKFNTLGQKTTMQSHPVVLSSEQEAVLESIKAAIEDSPTGLATEATLAGLRSDFNTEDFASQATLQALLDELQLKASLAETQPVSVQNFPASQTIDATNLDIRNLSELSDSVTAYQGGTWTVDIQDNLDVVFPDDFPLPASQVAELQNIRALEFLTDAVDVSGSNIDVGNFPSEFPLPQSQVDDQKQIRDLNSTTDSVDVTGSTVSIEELNNDDSWRSDSVKVSSTFQESNVDISGTLETSTETVLFSHFFRGITEDRIWNVDLENGATAEPDATSRTYTLHTTSTPGSRAVLSSRRRIVYAPGRTMKALLTFSPGQEKEGVRERHGYFDNHDGLFYQRTGSQNAFVLRSSISGSVVEDVIPQQDWNIDRLDGQGLSGLTLGEETIKFFILEFFWQGAGGVRYGFQKGGRKIWCHRIDFGVGGGETQPFMSNPNLTVRHEIENISSTEAFSASIACNVVKISGDTSREGYPVSASNGINGQPVGQTLTPILSVRRRPSVNFSKKVWELIDIAPLISGNDISVIEFYLNATLTGASWQDRGLFTQFSAAATAMSGGTLVGSAYIRGNVTPPIISSALIRNINDALGEDISEVGDTLTIAARNFSGSTSFSLGLNWRER